MFKGDGPLEDVVERWVRFCLSKRESWIELLW